MKFKQGDIVSFCKGKDKWRFLNYAERSICCSAQFCFIKELNGYEKEVTVLESSLSLLAEFSPYAEEWLKKLSKALARSGGDVSVERINEMSLVELADTCGRNHIDLIYTGSRSIELYEGQCLENELDDSERNILPFGE